MALASPDEPSQLQPVQVNDSVISAKHLTKKFGDETAVQDVSFEVPSSSIFGFIGPSGSGKTTTVRLQMGQNLPDAESIRFSGKSGQRGHSGNENTQTDNDNL
jgi:ABC-type multidrug transport system ATPase subunit